MTSTRAAVAAVAVSLALVLQLSVLSHLSWHGVVPNLVLLVVVGAALVRGAQFGMVLGFAAGVLLDLVPPADHVAGRWALALLLVGYVAGRVAQDTRFDAKPAALVVVATVGATSFLGTSVFALSGVLLRDPPLAVADLLQVIAVAVVWDVLLTPLVLPLVMAMFARLEPERAT
jgi:rod shape-determining protein MreD